MNRETTLALLDKILAPNIDSALDDAAETADAVEHAVGQLARLETALDLLHSLNDVEEPADVEADHIADWTRALHLIDEIVNAGIDSDATWRAEGVVSFLTEEMRRIA